MAYDPIQDGRSRGSLKTLHRGDSHPDVRLLKRLLAGAKCQSAPAEWADYNMPISADYNPPAVTCVREVQARTDGKLKVDGICGPKTWAYLLGLEKLPDAPSARPSRARLLALLAHLNPRLEQMKKDGNAATGGSGNACAATASQVLIFLGVRTTTELWAQTLADETEAAGWERITEPSQVQRGDLIVCADNNRNGASDHVWFSMSNAFLDAKGRFAANCFDNRRDQPIGYQRNLTGKGYTRMKYALRMPK